jgi:alpha-galactosidase
MKAFSTGLLALLAAATLYAQPDKPNLAVSSVDVGNKVFRLDGGGVSYVFGVNPRGELQQLYWGGRLAASDSFPQAVPMPELASFDSSYTTTPQEFAGWGAGLFVEPALKISFADGVRDLVLHYESYTKTVSGLDVLLKDISRPIYVTLHYAMDAESGILGRSATIENRGTETVMVEQAAAAAWALPPAHYTLNYLTGRWAGEWNLTQEAIRPGERVIESRRGSTGHQANPWFAIQAGEPREEQGEVWFGALAWSGSWRITVEAGPVGCGARDRRLQSIRLWLRAACRRAAGDAGLLWRLCGQRAGRGFPAAASLRAGRTFCRAPRRRPASRFPSAAGDLQLVGGNGL